jgi:hypothetical protein
MKPGTIVRTPITEWHTMPLAEIAPVLKCGYFRRCADQCHSRLRPGGQSRESDRGAGTHDDDQGDNGMAIVTAVGECTEYGRLEALTQAVRRVPYPSSYPHTKANGMIMVFV